MNITQHQKDWATWLRVAFPEDPVVRPKMRVTRFLEEAIELAQALGVEREKAHELLDFVYDKPVGAVDQELAGSFATLLLVAESQGLDLGQEGVKELRSAMTEVIRNQIITNSITAANIVGGFQFLTCMYRDDNGGPPWVFVAEWDEGFLSPEKDKSWCRALHPDHPLWGQGLVYTDEAYPVPDGYASVRSV
jgi:NTP pyrophosphatase (non-canonical NTP hydrolase)